MPKVTKICIRCKDLEKSYKFYKDMVGLKEFSLGPEFSGHAKFLREGDVTLELVPADPDDKPPEVEEHSGINHFAFAVRNIEVVVDGLRKEGVNIISEPREAAKGMKAAFVEDPDGVRVELLEFA